MAKRTVKDLGTKVCSPEFGVTRFSTKGGPHLSRRKPCDECPWRTDVPVGIFPAEAFRTSAHTAHDGAMETFGCHMSKPGQPATCAGFLMRHAENNIGVRLAALADRFSWKPDPTCDVPVYPTYREMAVANGVDPEDPCLRPVRGNDDVWDRQARRWVQGSEEEE